jgi:hypothetical protein
VEFSRNFPSGKAVLKEPKPNFEICKQSKRKFKPIIHKFRGVVNRKTFFFTLDFGRFVVRRKRFRVRLRRRRKTRRGFIFGNTADDFSYNRLSVWSA